jgi:hypothetical protein
VIRSLLALVLILVPVLSGFAAAGAADPVPLAAGQLLRGRFVQERSLVGFNAPLKSEGHFLLAPGRGLVWRAEQPFAVTTVMTPAGLMQDVRGTETLRLSAAKLPFMSQMYAMLGGALTGDWAALERRFTVRREGGAGQGAGGWHLRLTPLNTDDPSMPVGAIEVSGNRFVEMVDVVRPSGDRDRLTFLDQVLSAAAPTAEEEQLLAAPGRP